MTPRFVFKSEARIEFIEAISHYETAQEGLGREFAREVVHALQRARAQPELFRRVRGSARKIRLKRFRAFSIYFVIKDDSLCVLSVFHGARNPAELHRRLK